MDVSGHTVIITGAASGLGASCAKLFAANGAKLALWDRNLEAAQTLASEIKGAAFFCDVTDEDSVKTALAGTIAKSGTPRVLINCAGILIGQRILGRDGPADLAHFQKTFAVNVMGTFNTSRLVAEVMSKADAITPDGARGVIINTASVAAFEGQIGQAAYSASKGAVVSMTLPMARELGKFGIRVMTIAPGAAETPMIHGVPDDIRQNIEAGIPFPSRFVKPEEFAKLAFHIAENDMLNGEVIRLDGAARLAAK